MLPRSVVMTSISAALAVTVLGCGRLPPPPSDPVAGSVYRVEIEPCLGLSTQRATAFAVVAGLVVEWLNRQRIALALIPAIALAQDAPPEPTGLSGRFQVGGVFGAEVSG